MNQLITERNVYFMLYLNASVYGYIFCDMLPVFFDIIKSHCETVWCHHYFKYDIGKVLPYKENHVISIA